MTELDTPTCEVTEYVYKFYTGPDRTGMSHRRHHIITHCYVESVYTYIFSNIPIC